MAELLLQPTPIAQWHSVVNEAQMSCSLELGEELESYLVFLLMRFIGKPEMVMSIVATEFLHSIEFQGNLRNNKLREIGDKCLLFSGLFPGVAQRRRVAVSYYVDMGRNAYYTLATFTPTAVAHLYQHVGNHFIVLTEVLHALRKQDGDTNAIRAYQKLTKNPHH